MYAEISDKVQFLTNNRFNFKVKYEEKGGWGPCKEFFYQVWERD